MPGECVADGRGGLTGGQAGGGRGHCGVGESTSPLRIPLRNPQPGQIRSSLLQLLCAFISACRQIRCTLAVLRETTQIIASSVCVFPRPHPSPCVLPPLSTVDDELGARGRTLLEIRACLARCHPAVSRAGRNERARGKRGRDGAATIASRGGGEAGHVRELQPLPSHSR